MFMKWTDDQQHAIDSPRPGSLPSQTLLVAAAAGSGKTAVLVERIIQRLQDKERPLSIQELLVVTFTKAAAAEMSARIGAKLAEVFNSTGDAKLEEQLSLLPSAHISTLHSFCQWVISSYFYRLDIDPTYRIGNEGELMLLKTDVLAKLLGKAYEENLYHMFEIADMFGNDRSDESIMVQILSLQRFAVAQADPEDWLIQSKKQYEEALNQPVLDTIWGQYFWKQQQQLIGEITERYESLRSLTSLPDGPTKWVEQADSVQYIMGALIEAKTWDAMHEAVALISQHKFKSFDTRSFKKELEAGVVSDGLVSQVKALGTANKEALQAMKSGPFVITEAQFNEQIGQMLPYVQGLIDLTLAFMVDFAAAKKELSMLDFSDLEHLCLALLRTKQEDGTWAPSEVALELQETFKEVMVDEYQDTSGVQEAIVNLVSRKDNRFYVGDVKQSIYRFRMANPLLFMEKYHRFGRDVEAVERRIDLSQNFRSDENILAFTNFVFRQIMTEAAAELTYGDEEALNPGRIVTEAPANWVGGPVELHLIDVGQGNKSTFAEDRGTADTATNGQTSMWSAGPAEGRHSNSEGLSSDEEDDADLENDEKETAFIIEKLQALKAQGKVVQNPDGTYRSMAWRDVVILLRSVKTKAGRMVEALRQAGIPAYAEENSGYFSALEVKLLLALLQVIDNPEQDLPMAAVLSSPFVGLDANELGHLRMSGEGSLWSLLPAYGAAMDNDVVIRFVERLEAWRTYSRQHSVSDLLWTIYEEMNYVDYVSAMPNGLVRRANVMALYERAKQYEAGSFRGIFRFLRFLESLQEAGQDLGIGKTVSEADDVVRIMSIHKSKGLEFPVVFLASSQKKFNLRDIQAPMLLHGDSGVAVKGYFEEYRVLYASLPWLHMREQLRLAAKAEEERILYVALTRARDKLFITGFVKDFKGLCQKQAGPALVSNSEKLPTSLITGADSYLDWFIMSLSRHLEGNPIRVYSEVEDVGLMDLPDKTCRLSITLHDGARYNSTPKHVAKEPALLAAVERLEPIQAEPLADEIIGRFNFAYPYMGAVQRAAKISVSELKRRFAEPEEEATHMVEANVRYKQVSKSSEEITDLGLFEVKPQALMDQEEVTSGARWGTLMHEAMQWLPMKAYTQQSLREALDRLTLDGYFTVDERRVLNERALYRFFTSALGKRLLASSQVAREWPFSMLIEGHEVYPEVEPREKLFLQGIVDTAFLEDNQWVLVDYKTDRVTSAEELVERYGVQLRIYSHALERLTKKPVKERYIYSFRLHEAVAVPNK
ncbi:UvrD-helicase domain-containing protein [Veillonella criceti]|nr:UvrD-helicase domain-containing protein [Veillonella criceti]